MSAAAALRIPSRAPYYSSAFLDKQSKSTWFGALLFLCAAGFAAGVYLLVSASAVGKSRDENLVNYIEDVEHWTDDVRPSFLGVDIYAEAFGQNVTLAAIESGATSYEDLHKWEEGHSDLPKYEPLFYEGSVGATTVTVADLYTEMEQDVAHDFKMSQVRFSIVSNGANSNFTASFPLWKVEKYPGVQECRLRSSTVHSFGKCKVLQRARTVCITVQSNDEGSWEVDRRANGSCWQGSHSHTPGLVDYEDYRLGHRVAEEEVSSTLKLLIRSSNDPYVQAANLTNGTMYFGTTSEERSVEGLVLVIVSCALTLPALCFFWDTYYGEDSDIDWMVGSEARKYKKFREEEKEPESVMKEIVRDFEMHSL
ncbi:hypothetical protein CYMTET_48092 [Cymbomonas tetramitiformis]|uniref:Uncharacterized protein n=1 Tax=Cymbomonas tetramitiformis TaxID=36881 RepID=A0AAE0BSX8_9CHLO|nr:hypothetical protein CYMTET_48092 [Cymbomonas tetramitiformis]